MTKLLRSELFRLRKTKLFWACAAAMALYGLAVCLGLSYSMRLNGTEIPLETVWIQGYGLSGFVAIPGLLLAALCSVFVGTEYSGGTIRNKVIVGHTRTAVYWTGYLTCAVSSILLSLIYTLVVLAVGIPIFGFFRASAVTLLQLVLCGTVMLLSYTAIFHLTTTLLQSKTAAAIVNLLGVIVSMFLCVYLLARIAEPATIEAMEIVRGEQVWKTIPNSRYLSQTARAVCQFLVDLLPSGQSLQLSGMNAPHLWRMALYGGVIMLLSPLAGALAFQKKDLK